MAVPLDQGDQDDLRAAQESHRGSDRPNAASDEDRAARAIDQSIKIFLPITRRDDGGTVARQDDLRSKYDVIIFAPVGRSSSLDPQAQQSAREDQAKNQ